VIEDQEFSTEEPLNCPPEQRPPEQRQQVETLVHRGIQFLLTQCLPKIAIAPEAYDDMKEMNVRSTSSHW
jgi:hypothetical protein